MSPHSQPASSPFTHRRRETAKHNHGTKRGFAGSGILRCNIAQDFVRVIVHANKLEVGPMTSRRSRARHAKIRPSASSGGMQPAGFKSHPYLVAAAAAAGALAASALVNRQMAKKAERENPPAGQFLEIEGVRLHYVVRGEGEPLVLLHGNGSMIQDFESSGLIDLAAKKYRVIVFDRPGYGHSERPRSTIWTPQAQADLIHGALEKIGVSRAIFLGHSWGASVAVALALKYPEAVSGLVLASGYYYPTVRADVVVLSGPAVPVIGDIMSHTISPLLSRAAWPLLMGKIFGPAPVPEKFSGFPREMTFRPSQIRTSAAESALMIPDAFAFRGDYAKMKMPMVIIAGEEDRLIDIDQQSARLHGEVAQSSFVRVPGAGHMVHQTATDLVMAAIDEAAAAKRHHPTGLVPRAA